MVERGPKKWFADLSIVTKTIFLSQLALEFTLIIRDITTTAYDDLTLRRTRGIGEMLHVIMPYVIAINKNDDQRYPDMELVVTVFEQARYYGLESAFQ